MIASFGPYWVNRSPVVVFCEPYQVNYYPWIAQIPDLDLNPTTWYYLYNDPTHDGVSFNINLGGYAPAWISKSLGETYFLLVEDRQPVQVDGPVLFTDAFSGQKFLDLWRYSNSFVIDDPVVSDKYLAVGGRVDGSNNPIPGHTEYKGVASFDAWARSYIQPKVYGKPIICELWYSLNMTRSNPLRGYNNYTFLGDMGAVSMPELSLSQPGAYVKNYHAGIFKATADMMNLQDSDYVYGVSYVGNSMGGVLRAIKDGVVVSSDTSNLPATYVYANMDCIFEDDLDYIGTGKSNSNYLEISSDHATVGFYPDWPDATAATNGLIDTYQVKFAFMVDSYTGLEDYMHDASSFLSWQPGMFYTLPNPPLACAPGPQPGYVPPPPILPPPLLFLETFTGTGNVDQKAPDIAPPGVLWTETYSGNPALRDGSGFYDVLRSNDYQEIYFDEYTTPSGNTQLSNYRAFEIGWIEDPLRQGYASILISIRDQNFENKPVTTVRYFDLTIEGSIDYSVYNEITLETNFRDADFNSLGWTSNNWAVYDQTNYTYYGLNRVRVEIEDLVQRVYLNGVLIITANIDFTGVQPDVSSLFILPSGGINLDYFWMSNLVKDDSFNTTSVPPPQPYLLSKFYIMYTGVELPLQGQAPQIGFSGRTWDTDATYPAVINFNGAVQPTANQTQKFYASYGDPTLTTFAPITTGERKLSFYAQIKVPQTDVAGTIFVTTVNFAKVAGVAITVTMSLKIDANGENATQFETIIREGATELANETAIVPSVFPGSERNIKLEIDNTTQRIYWDDTLVTTFSVDLENNPSWGYFCHTDFTSDNPPFYIDGTTPAIEGGLTAVLIDVLRP